MADAKEVERILEERCGWYERNLMIRDEHSRIIPFILNPIQKEMERMAIEDELDGVPSYFLVLKARQGGCSTWSEAHLFRKALLEENTRVLVTAHKEDASRNIFGMARRYYDHLPKQPGTKKSATNAMHMEHNDSEFIVQTAGSGTGAGRSYTFSAWHGSECDNWPDADGLFAAVMQAVPDVPGTIRILESTSEGPGYMMHRKWTDAKQGRGGFRPIFFSWFDFPKNTREVTWEDMVSNSPKDYVHRFGDILNAFKEIENAVGESSGTGNRHPRSDEGRGGSENQGGRGQAKTAGGPKGKREVGTGKTTGGWGHRASDPIRRYVDTGNGSIEERRKRASSASRRRSRVQGHQWNDGSKSQRYRDHRHSIKDLELLHHFQDSLTNYEFGLISEFNLTYEQINCLRFLLEVKCEGDENKRKKEHPSRPEEAFEASGGDVLDQAVLARWHEEAKQAPPIARIVFEPTYDKLGKPILKWREEKRGLTSIFKWPKPHERFVMFVDTATGTSDGDWTVAFVMDVETGDQYAEYRGKQDPDEGVDQVEMLGVLYNKAYTAVEVSGGFGWPYVNHLEQRSHLNGIPMYERTTEEKVGGVKVRTKRAGWDTNTKTRPKLVAASKESVRKELCRLRSIPTIEECQTLHSNPAKGGKVEARLGFHDDGWIAYSGACLLRNERLGEVDEMQEQAPRKKFPDFEWIHREEAARKLKENSSFKNMDLRQVVEPVVIEPASEDSRRSWLS